MMSRTPYTFFAVHVALALAPLGMAFVPLTVAALPLLWLVALIPLSQIVLLSVWLVLTPRFGVRKIIATMGVLSFLAIWRTIAEYVVSTGSTSIGWSFLATVYMYLAFLLFLCLVMAGLRRKVGTIGRIAGPIADEGESTSHGPFQYSLFALLVVSSTVALILSLVQTSRLPDGPDSMVVIAASVALMFLVFAINMLTAIWAALGAGRPSRRLVVVFFVSIVLGLTLASAMSHDQSGLGWWFFVSSSLTWAAPTVIVVLSLLFFRRRGYRLAPSHATPSAEIPPAVG